MKLFFCLIFILFRTASYAQSSQIITAKPTPDSLKVWRLKNKAGVDLSEVTFVNWNAGGSNSISALSSLISTLNYKKNRVSWNNRGVFRLGGNKQEAQRIRKTDDALEIASNIGYQKDTLSNWYYSGRFNLKTQLLHGYSYPDRDNPISKFFAPGYVFLGVGAEYGKRIEEWSLYMSPLTYKGTMVLDRDLADSGAFGVEPAVYDSNGNLVKKGRQSRSELGLYFTATYEASLFENINIRSQAELYSDYINSFGNIDVNWEVLVNFRVNDFVRAALGSHLIYDDDVDAFEEIDGEQVNKGPKLQWKQILGIGVTMDF
jgi:hypothetical protein